MFDAIITYSIRNKLVIGIMILGLIAWGSYSVSRLPIDAVPDITNNQVQVITVSPSLSTQEVEQLITTPVELALQNIQKVTEIRSVSRFGLSVVTVVFRENMDIYLARQLVNEHLKRAEEEIPAHLGKPELAPISTGLGEIYQYVVRPADGYEDQYSLSDLRTIQDWIVKRQLSGIDGVVEVNTLGGQLKQYEVSADPALLKSMNVSLTGILDALEGSNENTGGAYIEKSPRAYFIRTDGIARTLDDIGNIVVDVREGTPILIRDVATVKYGTAPRYGATTRDGREVVSGTVMMLKGENSAAVTRRVKERMEEIRKSLPEGVVVEPFLDRHKLVSTAIGTVRKNLIEGGLIVIFILVLLLGNFRAGLIVASVIPLAMLFAVSMMRVFGISANLMSLGAIDFGLIVDGAVIIVESIVHRLHTGFAGNRLSRQEMDREVEGAAIRIRKSAAFGEIIILMVYLPILALVGIEGKMFKPMAQTVMLAIAGALILSLTYVPMMSALFLNRSISAKRTISDRIIDFFQRMYSPVLHAALRFKIPVVVATMLLFGASLWVFSRMGGEFIPTLEEGDLALHQILPPGSSLSQSVAVSKVIQEKLMTEFPEVKDVVTKIGAAEIPTDPMPIETGDIMVIMKPKKEWTSARSRPEMFEKMEASLKEIPGLSWEFSQPIQMRFNELMTGSRADIAIKLYGDDLDLLYKKAKEAEAVLHDVPGIGTIKVEQTVGMPQIIIRYDYGKLAQYGLQVRDVNRVVRTAFAGETAGYIYEGDRKFDLVVRLEEGYRRELTNVQNLFIPLPNGSQVPLSAVAEVGLEDAPMQISRDNTHRRIIIGVNTGGTDVQTLVESIQETLDAEVQLPAGYYFTYGGQFENLRAARARLAIAVPLALGLILILLYFTFGSIWQSLLIFTAIPLSAIGGIWALELRQMPFSISAGIGFIALFGVAVLNGIVLIGEFNHLREAGVRDIRQRILEGTRIRLRPVIMTASVASLGFLPMALSRSGGAEVQRPLATVVIGGLITATFLTLVIMPILYSWLARWQESGKKTAGTVTAIALLLFLPGLAGTANAQQPLTLDDALRMADENHPALKAASLELEGRRSLAEIGYRPGVTEIHYNGDGLFKPGDELVHEIGFTQNFQSPGQARAMKARATAEMEFSALLAAKTREELHLQVRLLYQDLQYTAALVHLYRDQAEIHEAFHALAAARRRLGEAGAMEELNLLSALREAQANLDQATERQESLRERFALLIGAEGPVTATDSLGEIPLEGVPELRTPALDLARQNISREEATLAALRSARQPEFQVGYAAQRYYHSGWLSGIGAGIRFSLFPGPAKTRIQAQGLQLESARAVADAEALRLESELLEYLGQVRQFETGARKHRELVETVNPELERLANLRYRAGEIGYVELLSTLEHTARIRRAYLEQIRLRNQAAAFVLYLSNPQ